MFGSSAALKAVQLENAQLRLELEELKKLVQAITQDAVTQQEISGLVSEAGNERSAVWVRSGKGRAQGFSGPRTARSPARPHCN